MKLLLSDRLGIALFFGGFVLAMFGCAVGTGFEHPAWALSGPGLAGMALAALLHT